MPTMSRVKRRILVAVLALAIAPVAGAAVVAAVSAPADSAVTVAYYQGKAP
ncbi:hypothetical protein [Actinophytocola xinjiangensis]|uniref:hypothetical protein n=1 Tax=Actinophytocola xinjiangensis TaxID=485602 RepID=UPI000B29F8AA|nr:hypothetical protein [Actinophytocola xinjiangensis]